MGTDMTTAAPRSVVDERRLPVGAEVLPGAGILFRVWAPDRGRVEAMLESSTTAPRVVRLSPAAGGYHSGLAEGAGAGALYRFRLDGGARLLPDPASRFQPRGPRGASEAIDPDVFAWTDHHWRGLRPEGQVLYEMHAGTFTPEGTWEAAARRLPELRDLGVTALELLPVADFPGTFGWGYDGVDLFAPTRLYGRPDDFRRFVDAAHGLGLGVLLDVVYNHLGPAGNCLGEFSRGYFTDRYVCEWGDAINFDGEDCGPVREFFISNAAYWAREFHLDGLRIDATQSIFDRSSPHVITEIVRAFREAASPRDAYIIAENEPQSTWLLRERDDGGAGVDALWNDDFHHSARVAVTGRREAYFTDYLGKPQELISAAKRGYLYQGQRYVWQAQRRGTPTRDVPPAAFVNYLQNHDQIANTAGGWRLHRITSSGRARAITTLLLLGPGTPLLFQGQEFAASTPFHYFADNPPELVPVVAEGRAAFLSQFASLSTPEARERFQDPADPRTFAASKLDPAERERHAEAVLLHRDLIHLRRSDPVFGKPRSGGVDGAVLAEQAFVLRYFGERGDDRLLVINLGRELGLVPAPEPLLAPPESARWELLWSSEHPRYGGSGTPTPETGGEWHLAAESAVVLRAVEDAPG